MGYLACRLKPDEIFHFLVHTCLRKPSRHLELYVFCYDTLADMPKVSG
jgi:hypothetical protein